MANLPNQYRGDTFTYNLNFKDSSGQPIDISNTVIWFTLKGNINVEDSEADLQVSYTFPADANSAAGIGTLEIPASETSNLGIQSYYYDMQWINGTNVQTLQSGKITIKQDVTRSTS